MSERPKGKGPALGESTQDEKQLLNEEKQRLETEKAEKEAKREEYVAKWENANKEDKAFYLGRIQTLDGEISHCDRRISSLHESLVAAAAAGECAPHAQTHTSTLPQ
jgi:chromosome segregation ATPase